MRMRTEAQGTHGAARAINLPQYPSRLASELVRHPVVNQLPDFGLGPMLEKVIDIEGRIVGEVDQLPCSVRRAWRKAAEQHHEAESC